MHNKIDKLKSENLCLGVESPDKSIKIVDTAFTKSQQNFNVTPEQLKILEKIAGSSNV